MANPATHGWLVRVTCDSEPTYYYVGADTNVEAVALVRASITIGPEDEVVARLHFSEGDLKEIKPPLEENEVRSML